MLPARRSSKSAKRSRRAHHALRPVNLEACPQCNAARLTHRACPSCGYVNGRIAVKIVKEEE